MRQNLDDKVRCGRGSSQHTPEANLRWNMGNGTAPQKDFEGETALQKESEVQSVKRFRWARWNAPLILLILAFTFMMAAILSNASQGAPDSGCQV